MSAVNVVIVLLAAALVFGSLAWSKAGSRAWSRAGSLLWAPACVGMLAVAALVAAVPDAVQAASNATATLLVVLAGLVAVVGGGPVTARVFTLVDGHGTDGGPDHDSLRRAGEVLRGGAWIGVLERAGVFATLVAGWPAGLAIVLGLKGLGRYPELRSGDNTGTAERFIIGTFTSVLWASACAGVVRLLL